MASQRSRKHESCAHEDCGSRRFHVGEDGFTYCDQGHQQSERGTVITEDTGEMVMRGRTSRKKDSDAESATSRASSFTGSHAFEHYLLCIQLVLRKQLHWLIHTQKLPEELEAMIKDLWALHLQKVQTRIAYDTETDTEAPSSQRFSSQSESDATTASRSTRRSRRRREKEKVKEGSPSLIETVAFCYIGLVFLRLPVTVADIHQWMSNGQLLYYRAVREVPLGMRERLPPRYQAQLEPQDPLPASSLHAAISAMLDNFNLDFGMSPPALNMPLIMYRWLRELMLPLEVYAATRRLAQVLELTFEFQSKIDKIPTLQYPEARLMAIMVVATKLLFPFDAFDRYVATESDLSAIRFDWNVWNKENTARKRKNMPNQALSYEECFVFNETKCVTASDDELDAYLDWYESSIASEEIRERGRAGKDADLRRAMFGMFPTHSQTAGKARSWTHNSDGRPSLDRHVRAVQSTVRPRLAKDERSADESLRPVGSSYRRWRDASELSGVAEAFIERAAELAGLSVDEMVKAVFAVERKMQKLEERLRREDA